VHTKRGIGWWITLLYCRVGVGGSLKKWHHIPLWYVVVCDLVEGWGLCLKSAWYKGDKLGWIGI